MSQLKYSALVLPILFLSGCVIVASDHDIADARAMTVVHDRGEEDAALRTAARYCDRYGDDASLVNVDDDYKDGQVRSTFECD